MHTSDVYGKIHEVRRERQGERGGERERERWGLCVSLLKHGPTARIVSVCFSKWKDSELAEVMRRRRVNARECVSKRKKRSHKCTDDGSRKCAPCRPKSG